MYGKMRLSYEDGRFFQGFYEDDQKNGLGVYSWPDGRMFFGTWIKGKIEGEGVEIDSDGTKKKGIWINGEKYRIFQYVDQDEIERFIERVIDEVKMDKYEVKLLKVGGSDVEGVGEVKDLQGNLGYGGELFEYRGPSGALLDSGDGGNGRKGFAGQEKEAGLVMGVVPRDALEGLKGEDAAGLGGEMTEISQFSNEKDDGKKGEVVGSSEDDKKEVLKGLIDGSKGLEILEQRGGDEGVGGLLGSGLMTLGGEGETEPLIR